MRYFALSGTPKNYPVDIDKDWLEANRGVLLPNGCTHLHGERMPNEIAVASAVPPNVLTWISPFVELSLAGHDLLLDMLGPEGVKAGAVVAVRTSAGEAPGKYLAFRAHHGVLVRGQSISTLKGACEKCGLAYYWPQPADKPETWYLVRSSLKDEAPLYYGSTGMLILREDIYQRAKRLNIQSVRFRELPILDQPLDGLPADLTTRLSPERQAELGDLLTRDVTDYDRIWAQRFGNVKPVDKDRVVEWVPPKRHT